MKSSFIRFGVVIPTIREELFGKWLAAWKPHFEEYNVTLYVVEDHLDKEIRIDAAGFNFPIKHYSWRDIDEDLKDKAWIIPRKCDSVRSYGFLKAYQDNMFITVTLDDDCFPVEGVDLLGAYLKGFEEELPYSSYYDVFREHVANGRYPSDVNRTQYTRGFPYKYRQTRTPVIQYGMWDNVPDFDGMTQMQNEGFKADCNTKAIVPKGLALTGCIMNAAWKTEYTVLMYQLLMGEIVKGGQSTKSPYDRWGDIWSGLLAKAVCDAHNLPIAINGWAKVYHSRASVTSKNIQQEASGMVPNEYMWEAICQTNKSGDTFYETYWDRATWAMGLNGKLDSKWYHQIRQAVTIWAGLLK